MRMKYKIRSTADPLLGTRLDPKRRKRLHPSAFVIAAAVALAAFWLGSWWIKSIIDAF